MLFIPALAGDRDPHKSSTSDQSEEDVQLRGLSNRKVSRSKAMEAWRNILKQQVAITTTMPTTTTKG